MISESVKKEKGKDISKTSLDSISPTPPSQQLRPPQITVLWLQHDGGRMQLYLTIIMG